MLHKSEWQRLIGEIIRGIWSFGNHIVIMIVVSGMTLWYITRPVFILVGHCWHIVVPLSCFILDKDLKTEWPGSAIHRNRQEQDNIGMEEVMGEDKNSHHRQVVFTTSAAVENREFNQTLPN